MRVKNSIKNIFITILTQVVIVLLGFWSRKVFLDNLGTDYLGVNGLLTNILSMLSLVEGGIGTSIVYNLYKPLAEDNKEEVTALVQLYKKIYFILSLVMLGLSVVMYLFVGDFIKRDSGVEFVGIVYFIFVFKNIVSYLNAHKWSLINADQKGYILARYNLIFNVITTVFKIAVLQATQNYVLFLLIELGIFIIQNIWNGRVVNQRYSYIKTKKKYEVDKEITTGLYKNTKALFLHKIGNYCVFGTDNLLISYLVNIKTVGLYSNYTMIVSQLGALINPIIWGLGESVGNLIATESKEKTYEVFKVTYLVSFWIYSLAIIFLYNLLEPFINWWLGDGLLLDKLSLIFILVNFYLTGVRYTINIFKSKAGIFTDDKYIPLIESAINLGASIILAKYFGLAGIFIGTTISTITLPLWTQSKLVYNKVFEKSVKEYFKKYFYYVAITLVVGALTTMSCNVLVQGDEFIHLVFKGIICVVVPNVIYIMLFYKTDEFKYILGIIKPIIIGMKGKLIKR